MVVVMMMILSLQTRFGIVIDLNKLVVALCWEAGGKTDELTPVHNQGKPYLQQCAQRRQNG